MPLLTGAEAPSAPPTTVPILPVARPRNRWQLVAGPAAGGYQLSLTEATDRQMRFKLTEPSEISFTLDGRHPQAAAVEELTTDVHVLWSPADGPTQVLARGRVGDTGDDIGEISHSVTFAVLDYRAVLQRRRLYDSSIKTWTATDQAEIAWQLLQQTQTRPGGGLGISKGMGNPTGITRDRTYEVGDSIGERVQELSETVNGFDWDISPTSPSGLALDIWYPQRGVDRGVVLEYGGLVAKVRREVNTSEYGNALRYTGKDGALLTPQELEASGIATAPQGRWDLVFGDDGLTTQAALNDRAAWQLAESQVIRPAYTVTLRAGAWTGPDHIWLGDTVRLVIRSGRLDVDTSLRVYEIGISLDDDGAENVEITVGAPRPNFRRRASTTEKRLKNLERR